MEEWELGKGCTVVLSACDTARGVIQEEGVVGLARAFLAAGAGAVLVALWKVDDHSTALFMRELYSSLLNGCSLATAVHSTMLRMARVVHHHVALEHSPERKNMMLDALQGPAALSGCSEQAKLEGCFSPRHWGAFLVIGANTVLPPPEC
eukprot:2725608-Rhodomonas_salina.1